MRVSKNIVKVLTTSIFVFSLFFLVNCNTTKKMEKHVTTQDNDVQVNITVILPGELDTTPSNVGDTNLYNTYFVTYKNGQTQTLQYEYLYNFYGVIKSSKVSTVDTLQYKVLWKDLN